MIMPISQVRNLKLREVNDLPEFTEMVTEQRWDLNQGILPKYTKRCLSCTVTSNVRGQVDEVGAAPVRYSRRP